MTDRFADKVALVTGGASGIGEAVARRFHADGATVVIVDIDESAAARLADELGGSYMVADLIDPAEPERAVAHALDSHGRLDMAANIAGIGGPLVPVQEYPVADWDRVIGVNLNAVYYCLRAELRHMTSARSGSVVNMGSMFSTVARDSMAAYVAAKHGVLGLTRAAALDVVAMGVRVNCVGPAVIDTPLLRAALDDAAVDQLSSLNPSNRLGTTDEVSSLVAWLCSNEASFVNGSFYSVDGGFTAR